MYRRVLETQNGGMLKDELKGIHLSELGVNAELWLQEYKQAGKLISLHHYVIVLLYIT